MPSQMAMKDHVFNGISKIAHGPVVARSLFFLSFLFDNPVYFHEGFKDLAEAFVHVKFEFLFVREFHYCIPLGLGLISI